MRSVVELELQAEDFVRVEGAPVLDRGIDGNQSTLPGKLGRRAQPSASSWLLKQGDVVDREIALQPGDRLLAIEADTLVSCGSLQLDVLVRDLDTFDAEASRATKCPHCEQPITSTHEHEDLGVLSCGAMYLSRAHALRERTKSPHPGMSKQVILRDGGGAVSCSQSELSIRYTLSANERAIVRFRGTAPGNMRVIGAIVRIASVAPSARGKAGR